MSKQSLLEEFDKQFPRFACSDDYECPTVRTIGENPDKAFDGDVLLDGETVIRDSLKQFLSKAIDQTREETIKEILSELRLKLRKRGRPKQGRPKRGKPIADTAFLTESDLESVLNK